MPNFKPKSKKKIKANSKSNITAFPLIWFKNEIDKSVVNNNIDSNLDLSSFLILNNFG